MRSLRSVPVVMILLVGLLAAGCGGGAAERRVDELEVRVDQLRTEVDQLLGGSASHAAREVVATASAGSLQGPEHTWWADRAPGPIGARPGWTQPRHQRHAGAGRGRRGSGG